MTKCRDVVYLMEDGAGISHIRFSNKGKAFFILNALLSYQAWEGGSWVKASPPVIIPIPDGGWFQIELLDEELEYLKENSDVFDIELVGAEYD